MAEKKDKGVKMVSFRFEPKVLKAIDKAQELFQENDELDLSKAQVVSTLILRGVAELEKQSA